MENKWIKIIASILTVISWSAYFGLKTANPDSDQSFLLILSFLLIIVTLVVFLGKNFLDKFKEKEKEPEPISEEEIMKIIKKEVTKRKNNLCIENPFEWQKTKNVNKNVIYARKVNMELDSEQFIIVLNATYPKLSPTFPPLEMNGKPVDKDNYLIDKYMNEISLNPLDEPDREFSEEIIDPFGKPIRRTERITHKENQKEEEKKVI